MYYSLYYKEPHGGGYLIILPYRPIFNIMEVFRLHRTALCVYECLRLAFVIGACVLLQPAGTISFPWLALITPGAMFLLMALFWRLNMDRYRSYGPLFMAGKGLGIITTIFWLFFIKSSMIREMFLSDAALFLIPGTVFFLVIGDVLSVWLVITIIKSASGGGNKCV
jgi:hypothetical protein